MKFPLSLTKQEVLAELLDLILQEPSADLDERLRFKLPNIASEVITCDVAQINEKLSSDTSLLDKLYAFLDFKEYICLIQAGFWEMFS